MYLNCHTYFQPALRDLSPDKLLQEAVAHEVSRFVLADINNTSGILKRCVKPGNWASL